MGSWGADMMTITDTVEPDFAGAAHHVLDTPEPVTFKVLGPLEVIRDGVDHAPTPPKVLHLLAMLVIRPGKLVQTDSITYEMWASKPPRSARKTMHTYVHHLRRWIRETGLAEDPEAVLITKAPGYLLRVEPGAIDAVQFERALAASAALEPLERATARSASCRPFLFCVMRRIFTSASRQNVAPPQ